MTRSEKRRRMLRKLGGCGEVYFHKGELIDVIGVHTENGNRFFSQAITMYDGDSLHISICSVGYDIAREDLIIK